MSDLMIIESPNKIKTIGKYLQNKDIQLLASYGHVRDLSKWGLGFTKEYEINWTKTDRKIKSKNIIDVINEAANKAKNIYLSTDPDREGEAIAWHIFCILNKDNQSKCKRVVFNEITKNAIEKSLNTPRELDQNQINSYLARRLLDRRIGFKLSSYTKKKIGGISAGRVQSIALKFLKDRELEINGFVPEYWFNLVVELENKLELSLKEVSSNLLPIEIKNDVSSGSGINFAKEEDAKKVFDSLDSFFLLTEIKEPKTKKQTTLIALKTSTLYTESIKRLNMTTKQVETTAQKLFEGVDINGESTSLITYPRTDKNEFSETFLETAQTYIQNRFGKNYWQKPNYKKKDKNDDLVQGAHEGIRPTDINLTPEYVKPFLATHEHKLYELIWVYTVASLMADSLYTSTSYKFDNNNNKFSASIKNEVFDGYKLLTKGYKIFEKEEELKIDEKKLIVNQKYQSSKVEISKINKKPPAPYNESTLIQALEAKGIGRPSTYSSITNVVLNRDYATKDNNKKLLITELGLKVSNDLEENFSEFINYDYTKNMEKELDNISEAKTNWKEFLNLVFDVFDKNFDLANQKIPKVEYEKVEDKLCPNCNQQLVYKIAKKTQVKFIACQNFPKCKYAEFINNNNNDSVLEKKCPKCEKNLVKKMNKWKTEFISCSGYPECRYIEGKEEPEQLDQNCPNCQKPLVKRKNKWKTEFISCSGYPACRYIQKNQEQAVQLEENCPECQKYLIKRKNKWNKEFVCCSDYPTCKFIKNIKTTKPS